MFNKIKENYNCFEKMTNKIMKNGLKFSFILCLIATFILFTYDLTISSPITYHIRNISI